MKKTIKKVVKSKKKAFIIRTCSFCKKELKGLDNFHCKYCGQDHCTEHMIPENHACPNPQSPYRAHTEQHFWDGEHTIDPSIKLDKVSENSNSPVHQQGSLKKIKLATTLEDVERILDKQSGKSKIRRVFDKIVSFFFENNK